MINDYAAQVQTQQQERELTQRLERRLAAAERAVQDHGGERLAVVAYLARAARTNRRVVSLPAGC